MRLSEDPSNPSVKDTVFDFQNIVLLFPGRSTFSVKFLNPGDIHVLH